MWNKRKVWRMIKPIKKIYNEHKKASLILINSSDSESEGSAGNEIHNKTVNSRITNRKLEK